MAILLPLNIILVYGSFLCLIGGLGGLGGTSVDHLVLESFEGQDYSLAFENEGQSEGQNKSDVEGSGGGGEGQHKMVTLQTSKGTKLANVTANKELLGRNFKMVTSSQKEAKDGKQEELKMDKIKSCHYEGTIVGEVKSEVVMDKCAVGGNGRTEVTVLWAEKSEKTNDGNTIKPDNSTSTAPLEMKIAVFVESTIVKDFQEFLPEEKDNEKEEDPVKKAILLNVLSLLNRAQAYFNHDSLGRKIKLHLNKLYVIRAVEEGPSLKATHKQYLEQFQKFQLENRKASHGSWNYAILLFGRLDIRGNYYCDKGAMCDPLKSAAIVPFELWIKTLEVLKKLKSETVDINTGKPVPITNTFFYRNYIEQYNVHFLIQALGSSLGMDIDENLGCVGENNIMAASTLFISMSKWSECSRRALKEWIESAGSENCLVKS